MACIAAVKFALTSLLLAATINAPLAYARAWTGRPAEASLTSVRLAELPVRARETYELIRQGGPFRYEKDGAVFGNRERLLPQARRGYYREYTVPAPGSSDRGVRRIVCGGPQRAPHACYYSADHYASFRLIVE